jgi:hypothetical protein
VQDFALGNHAQDSVQGLLVPDQVHEYFGGQIVQIFLCDHGTGCHTTASVDIGHLAGDLPFILS